VTVDKHGATVDNVAWRSITEAWRSITEAWRSITKFNGR